MGLTVQDLLGNPIAAEKPKTKQVKRVRPLFASVNDALLASCRPYRIIRESTTKAWVVNL